MEEGSLEKTKDEVLIYSNTESKLREILQDLVKTKTILTEIRNNPRGIEDRKTIHKRLTETVFDDDYIDDKVNEISMSYMDPLGELKIPEMYITYSFADIYNLFYLV